ncbi:MAG: hypothetical protein ACLRXQ_01650 [Phascolarctobacterium faecium]
MKKRFLIWDNPKDAIISLTSARCSWAVSMFAPALSKRGICLRMVIII